MAWERTRKFLSEHALEVGVGAAAVAALGVMAYKIMNPPPAFKDTYVHFDDDDYPENLQKVAQAIYAAGAEDVFFQVEAQTLSKNFSLFAEGSEDTPLSERQLSRQGFVKLMASIGMSESTMVHRVFSAWDRDGSDSINFVELLQAITLCLKGSTAQKLEVIFHIMDTNGDGAISKEEMVVFFTNMYKMTTAGGKTEDAVRAHVQEMYDKADTDFSGTLTKEEFVELAQSSKFWAGETLTEYLDAMTKRFTTALGGTSAAGGK